MHIIARGTDAAIGFRGLRVDRDGTGLPAVDVGWMSSGDDDPEPVEATA
jgi:hypothetical protein